MQGTGNKGPHRTGKSILPTHVKTVWYLPSKTWSVAMRTLTGSAHVCPWRSAHLKIVPSPARTIQEVSLSLSLSFPVSVPPPLHHHPCLMGRNAESWISFVLHLPRGNFFLKTWKLSSSCCCCCHHHLVLFCFTCTVQAQGGMASPWTHFPCDKWTKHDFAAGLCSLDSDFSSWSWMGKKGKPFTGYLVSSTWERWVRSPLLATGTNWML